MPAIAVIGGFEADNHVAPSFGAGRISQTVELLVGKPLHQFGIVGIALPLVCKKIAGDGAARIAIRIYADELEQLVLGRELFFGQ